MRTMRTTAFPNKQKNHTDARHKKKQPLDERDKWKSYQSDSAKNEHKHKFVLISTMQKTFQKNPVAELFTFIFASRKWCTSFTNSQQSHTQIPVQQIWKTAHDQVLTPSEAPTHTLFLDLCQSPTLGLHSTKGRSQQSTFGHLVWSKFSPSLVLFHHFTQAGQLFFLTNADVKNLRCQS